MEVVPAGSGMEPMVRALIAAMERPNGALPARPQKIVVRDREVQFFLRGILHELNIKVEYQPELPLIEEILQSFAEAQGGRSHHLFQKTTQNSWLAKPLPSGRMLPGSI